MTFRPKGHKKQQQKLLQQEEEQQQQQQQHQHDRKLHGNNNNHQNRYDKTGDLQQQQQLVTQPLLGAGGGRPTAVTIATAPTTVAHPNTGGTPCICTAYGPRCYVIQKVSERAICTIPARTNVAARAYWTIPEPPAIVNLECGQRKREKEKDTREMY